MFSSILTSTTSTLSVSSSVICMITAIILGFIIAIIHMKTSKYSKNFIITLTVLPLLVQIVIMLVNGNVGTSIAVLGSFSLIRFRSVPGNSKEIISIFFAMVVGLCVGVGYVAFAVIITIITSIVLIIISKTDIFENKTQRKRLKIIIPENLDYSSIFDDIFNAYVDSIQLERVKTTNMGSMFEITYLVIIKNDVNAKKMIDEIRCRNGNLMVLLERENFNENEL